jgi:heme-degrading monooxygenase HmoA
MPQPTGYIYIWDFQVKPGSQSRFEEIYGPVGSWVQLFRRARGYIRTDLIQDLQKANRYVTIDYWDQESSYHTFREQFAEQFQAVDQECQELTLSEVSLGEFSLV